MRHKQSAVGTLMILMLLSFLGVARVSGALEIAAAEAGWQQANSNGFGDLDATEVSALGSFNGYLYAGTHNAVDNATIFRSPDGLTWTAVTAPGFGIPHDSAPPAILDMTVFGGRLYASTGRGGGPGNIWRTSNGTSWSPVVATGFSNPDNTDVTAMAIYKNQIYAGVRNQVAGAQIWSSYSGDSNSWNQAAPAALGPTAASITGMAEFGGALYAAVQSESPVQLWNSYGAAWTQVITDGFGMEQTIFSGGMAVFSGSLYVGAGNTASGAQLWRSSDGTTWTQAITPAFGDSNNVAVESVFVFQNMLFVTVKNSVTGMEVWRSTNGSTWTQANVDGFGDNSNTGSNWSNATGEFLDNLYVGTANSPDGGELWRLPCGPTVTATASGGSMHLAWTGETYNIYRSAGDPYVGSGSEIGSWQASPFDYTEALLGNTNSNAFYLVGPNASCGTRLGEFDFAITPGQTTP